MKKTFTLIAVLLVVLLTLTGCEPGITPEPAPEPDVWSAITSLDQLVGTWEYNGIQNCSFDRGKTTHTVNTQDILTITKSGFEYSETDINIMILPDETVLAEAQAWWTETGAINNVVVNGLTATFTTKKSFSCLEDAAVYNINQKGNKLKNTNLIDWIYNKQ